MMTEITWEEFRKSGLLLLVNQFLHIFGLAIVVYMEYDKVIRTYPARVKFRGFAGKSLDKAYINISKYMKEHGKELYDEVIENE